VKLAFGTLVNTVRVIGGSADERTIFRVGSISKLLTSAALVRMVEQDAVRLDDPVESHLPGFDLRKWRDAPMLVRHLATHTSGIRDPMYPGDDGTIEGFALAMSTMHPASSAGSIYSYSDIGISLLGNMLAAIAGKPFGDLIRDLVCQPLGMSDTVLELDASQAGRLLVGHERGRPVDTPTSSLHAPSRGYYSTVWDLLKFVAAQEDDPGVGVGLGWHVGTLPQTGKRLLWHNGTVPGYRSYLAHAPSTGCGVAALTNSDRPTDQIAVKLLDSAVHEMEAA
jgi:CubicO group peptidase (beta-lactamase class C family)